MPQGTTRGHPLQGTIVSLVKMKPSPPMETEQKTDAALPLRRSTRIAANRKSTQEASSTTPAKPAINRKRKNACCATESPQSHNKKVKKAFALTGYFAQLPQELLDLVLEQCSCKQLAMLETSCSYFKRTGLTENVAELRLKAIPRAKGMVPNPQAHEKYTSILHFVLSQSAAAAQTTAIAFGANHTAALFTSKHDGTTGFHTLYTTGRGYYGQLGHNNYEPVQQPKPLCIGYQPSVENPNMEEEITPAVVACGNEFTASITRRGALLTWGLGSRGELGHELPSAGECPYPLRSILSSRPAVRIVSVACGSSHTLAISELGCVWSCGRNQDGQLGNGSFVDGMQLQPITGIRGHRVVSCAAGSSHSMALASDGSLYTWGSGRYGQLGHSSLQAVMMIAPQQAIVLATPQKIAALEPGHLHPWDRVTSIAAGAHHGCAVTVGGTMLMFGRNTWGQLGLNDNEDRWRPTVVPISSTGEPNHNYRTVQVVCGLQHTLALIAHKGKVKAYSTGISTFGQLGHGNQDSVTAFRPIKALLPVNVVALQAGGHSSAAMCEGGLVYMWGRNDNGQLGLGDDVSRWKPELLAGYKAVHPDRTLRKSRRTAPRMRPIAPPVPAGPKVACNNQLATMFAQQAAQKQEPKVSTPLPADLASDYNLGK